MNGLITFLKRHDSLLFTIGEIGLVTGALIFTAKGTEKYLAKKLADESEDADKTPKEKCQDIIEDYWPAMIFFGSFVALRSLDAVYSHKIKMDYAKAIVAAQSTLLASKKKTSEVETNTQNDQLVPAEIADQENWDYTYFFDPDIIPSEIEISTSCMGREDANLDIFFIPSLGILFKDDLYHVQQASSFCSGVLEKGRDLTINNMLKYLGLGSISMGDELYFEGDIAGGDMFGQFSFDLAPAMTDDDNPILFFTINPNRCMRDIYHGKVVKTEIVVA